MKNITTLLIATAFLAALPAYAAQKTQTESTFPQASAAAQNNGTFPVGQETFPGGGQADRPSSVGTFPAPQSTFPTYPSGGATYPSAKETYPTYAATYPEDKTDKKAIKKKARELNEDVQSTGQKVVFADGRESTVYVREDLLRKDLKKMPVFLEDGSTVYMTPKQASRYLKRKEKRQKRQEVKQSRKEQSLEKALRAQIEQQDKKEHS